jgi:hypothetical protein
MKQILGLAVLVVALSQIGGCHFYLDAVPKIVITSEPLDISQQTSNHASESPRTGE